MKNVTTAADDFFTSQTSDASLNSNRLHSKNFFRLFLSKKKIIMDTD